jgi:hypothetical protein
VATTVQVRSEYEMGDTQVPSEAKSSGVSWGAVIAGAFVTAALSLILVALGTGMGLSSASLWRGNDGSSARAVGWSAIIWLIATELVASGIGGYIAGRLRTKWATLHTHEIYFRDTAHGFLVWAVSLVVTAAFLATAVTSLAGGTASNASTAAANASGTRITMPNEYFSDELFRTPAAAAAGNDAATREEANVILLNGIASGSLNVLDASYLSQLVSARTGLNQLDAQHRVNDVFTEDLSAANSARKAAAHSLYWAFVALLIGAFVASHAATVGGRQRDSVPRIGA